MLAPRQAAEARSEKGGRGAGEARRRRGRDHRLPLARAGDDELPAHRNLRAACSAAWPDQGFVGIQTSED